MGKQRIKPNYRRRVLRLPDLDHCKAAVLNSLGSPASRRVYEYAIDQFIAWYCSEPRLAFNRIVVVRYRLHLESRHLAANTINQQLAAVRRLAHEAADSGLLSPELAAGISRVKGVKQLGFRSGNWLSAEQSSEVLKHSCGDSMRAKRDYAMLAMLFGCGFRRSELVGLEWDDIQMRQGHWAVVDLIGKGGHIRTVPVPNWVKAALDQWTRAAGVCEGKIFRAVAGRGKVWGSSISQNVVWYVVRTCCERAGLEHIPPHDLRRTRAKLCHDRGGELEKRRNVPRCWREPFASSATRSPSHPQTKLRARLLSRSRGGFSTECDRPVCNHSDQTILQGEQCQAPPVVKPQIHCSPYPLLPIHSLTVTPADPTTNPACSCSSDAIWRGSA